MWVSSSLHHTGIRCRNLPHTTFIIIPQNQAFFKRRFPVFCKNRSKTAPFFKHLTQKNASKGGFFLQKTPGYVYASFATCPTENARYRVTRRKIRTLRIFKGFDVRQNPHKAAQSAGPFSPANCAAHHFPLYLQYNLLTYPAYDTGNTDAPLFPWMYIHRSGNSPLPPEHTHRPAHICCG